MLDQMSDEQVKEWYENVEDLHKKRDESSSNYAIAINTQKKSDWDWLNKNIEHALNHLGRITEPKKVMCSQAWYKDYTYNYDYTNNRSNNSHYFANDLLGQRIPITEQQYQDENLTTPNNLSQ